MRTMVLATALLAAACQRETPDVSQTGPSQSSTASATAPPPASTMNPPMPQERDNPTARPSVETRTQEVHLIEYAVHMPATLPAGRVEFNIENGGKENHAFEIEGNGVHQATEVLPRGNSASLAVDLKPGTYTVYCPVKGHKEKGMKTTVTVQ